MIKIQQADKAQANDIARLIMLAMNHECCMNFAGPDHTLADFERLMTRLVAAADSQYSYRNTLVAITPEHEVAGCIVAYDGGRLHELRQAFVAGAWQAFGIDYSGMADETAPGEYYLDSLAVNEAYRHRGVATLLLKAAIARGKKMGLPRVGLLVDKGNPAAEQLYTQVGFRFAGDTAWGGHPMKHLQIDCTAL